MHLLIFGLILQLRAAEKTALDQALENVGVAVTQERWVEYGDSAYREVEYQGRTYRIKFDARRNEFTGLDCLISEKRPNLVEATSSFHRTKLFVSFLQENCTRDAKGQTRTLIALDPRIGFTVPDSPHFPIKDRSFFWNPLAAPLNFGFAGSW